MMNAMLAVFGLGGWEVVLILAVVLILFGAKKLPGGNNLSFVRDLFPAEEEV